MALTLVEAGFEYVYDLDFEPDDLLPEFRSPIVKVYVSTDIDLVSPWYSLDTKKCKTYGDVFRLFAEEAMETLLSRAQGRKDGSYEYNPYRVTFEKYDSYTGQAVAEYTDLRWS